MFDDLFNAILQEGAKRAVQARPARPDDDTSEVLVAGEGFFYLGCGDDGQFYKFETPPDGAPTRVVVDADSFLNGLVPTGDALLALREPDGLLFKISVPELHLS